jgi:hypothetical protein
VDLYHPEPPSNDKASAQRSKTRAPGQASFIRRNARRAWFVASGPIATIGISEIREGRRVISGLLGVLQKGPSVETRLKTTDGVQIDLAATAFCCGISIDALKQRLRARQFQTALAAYVLFGLGATLLLLWLYAALHMAASRARMVAAIEYLPFCSVFFLLAFKSAWMNWQLRMRRLGSAVTYLRTTDPFLPR